MSVIDYAAIVGAAQARLPADQGFNIMSVQVNEIKSEEYGITAFVELRMQIDLGLLGKTVNGEVS